MGNEIRGENKKKASKSDNKIDANKIGSEDWYTFWQHVMGTCNLQTVIRIAKTFITSLLILGSYIYLKFMFGFQFANLLNVLKS